MDEFKKTTFFIHVETWSWWMNFEVFGNNLMDEFLGTTLRILRKQWFLSFKFIHEVQSRSSQRYVNVTWWMNLQKALKEAMLSKLKIHPSGSVQTQSPPRRRNLMDEFWWISLKKTLFRTSKFIQEVQSIPHPTQEYRNLIDEFHTRPLGSDDL